MLSSLAELQCVVFGMSRFVQVKQLYALFLLIWIIQKEMNLLKPIKLGGLGLTANRSDEIADLRPFFPLELC